MAAIAGPIESISLAGRPFAVTGDADVARKLGGFENTMIANGDGTSRQQKTRVPWSLTGLAVEVDDTQGDQEFLTALADGDDFFAVTVTYVSGVTYQGTGQISGEMAFSNQTSSAGFDLMGTGKLTPQ